MHKAANARRFDSLFAGINPNRMDELVSQTTEKHLIKVMLNHQTTIGAKRALTKITVGFTAYVKSNPYFKIFLGATVTFFLFTEIYGHYLILPNSIWPGPIIPSWISTSLLKKTKITKKLSDMVPSLREFSLASKSDYKTIYFLPPYKILDYWYGNPMLIDVRHPFLDQRLVQFLLSIPGYQKRRSRMTKSLLRRSMKGILPERIRRRPGKISLDMIICTGLKKEWHLINRVFTKPLVSEYGYVNRDIFMEYLNACHQGDLRLWPQVWQVISLEIWLRSLVSKKLF